MDLLRVAKVDNVILERPYLASASPVAIPAKQRLVGTLHLTPHHLIFSPNSTSSSADAAEIWVPYPSITLLTRLPQTLQGLYPLQVRTRMFDSYVLSFDKDREGGAEDVWQSVKDCAVAKSVEQLYAFYYTLPQSAKQSSFPAKTLSATRQLSSPLTDPKNLNDTSSNLLDMSPNTPSSGWYTYNPRTEFARQGVGSRTKAWRFTDINKDYSFCSTYPNKLVVPSRISDSVLTYAGKYRSKARIPALSYLHWVNHASITRSSQPMVGLKNARSAQDERLIECIFSAHLFPDTAYTPTSNPLSPVAPSTSPAYVYGATTTNLIIDARPTTNAMANVAKGAGTENMDNYRTGKKAYLGIDNIHVMRNSLKMIEEAIREVEENPSATLDRGLLRRSNWLKHISTLLDGALVIIKNIHFNASHVLIHCSDGWDRTSQLSATAQICLDPYYRTIDGFKVLVEKDWLSFGHKFLDRSGHLSSEKLFTVIDTPEDDSDEEFGGAQKAAQAFFASVQKQFTSNHHIKEISPVFHQFLDCVRQIQRQFPDRFEFNEDFLLDMHTQLYSCQYGTFLFNSEKDRRIPPAGTSGRPYVERTVSFWEDVDLHREKYVHKEFNPTLDDRDSREPNADQGILIYDARDVRYWHRLFKRGDDEMNGSATTLAQQAQGAEFVGPVAAGQVDPISIEGALEVIAERSGISREPSPMPQPRSSTPTTTSTSLPQLPSQIVPTRLDFSGSRQTQAQTQSRGADAPGWRWSQISTGAFSALQGAAKEIRTIGQEAINTIRSEVNDGEMWSRTGDHPVDAGPAPSASASAAASTRYTPSTALPRPTRLPSESNPWSMDVPVPAVSSAAHSLAVQVPAPQAKPLAPPRSTSQHNPWQRGSNAIPSLEDLSLREQLTPGPKIVPSALPKASSANAATDDEIKAAMGGDQKAWDPLGAL